MCVNSKLSRDGLRPRSNDHAELSRILYDGGTRARVINRSHIQHSLPPIILLRICAMHYQILWKSRRYTHGGHYKVLIKDLNHDAPYAPCNEPISSLHRKFYSDQLSNLGVTCSDSVAPSARMTAPCSLSSGHMMGGPDRGREGRINSICA